MADPPYQCMRNEKRKELLSGSNHSLDLFPLPRAYECTRADMLKMLQGISSSSFARIMISFIGFDAFFSYIDRIRCFLLLYVALPVFARRAESVEALLSIANYSIWGLICS